MNAADFFKQDIGFNRLLTDMAGMYAKHGRPYGAVRLANPTADEERALSAFFERDYFDQAMIRISLGDFERQLAKVFPQNAEFEALLAEYAKLHGNSQTDMRSATHKNKDAFTEALTRNLIPKYEKTPAEPWLHDVAAHMRRTYKPWVQQYANEPAKVITMIGKVAELLNNLPIFTESFNGPQPLSAFSDKFLGSPHKLDFDGEYSTLFLRALSHYFNTTVPYTIEDSIGLYLKAGLLTCGVLCQVTVNGLISEDCGHYNKLGEAHVLTLENIVRLQNVKSHGGKVFIIESPLVFASVAERLRGVNCTVISPMGRHSPALLRLLELFAAQGDTLYYSGNMDYKGLIHADKLYLMFGKQFVPWRYTKEDYEIAKNNGLLPDERKDLAMHNEDLALILSQMRKTGKSGNTMPLAPYLAEDVKHLVSKKEDI